MANSDFGGDSYPIPMYSENADVNNKELLAQVVEQFGNAASISKADNEKLFTLGAADMNPGMEFLAAQQLPKPGAEYVLLQVEGKKMPSLVYIGKDDFGVAIDDWSTVVSK